MGGLGCDASPPSSRRGLVIAMVASLIFIVLLRFLAGIMVWVMIVMVILVLGYGERSGASSAWFYPDFKCVWRSKGSRILGDVSMMASWR